MKTVPYYIDFLLSWIVHTNHCCLRNPFLEWKIRQKCSVLQSAPEKGRSAEVSDDATKECQARKKEGLMGNYLLTDVTDVRNKSENSRRNRKLFQPPAHLL